MKTILDDLYWRYAVKKYDASKRLTDDQLHSLLEVVRLAPSAYGLQPVEALVVESTELRAQLLEHSYGQRQVVDASHLIILCAKKNIQSSDIDEHILRTETTRQLEQNALNGYSEFLKRSILSQPIEEQLEWNAKQACLVIGMLLQTCAQLRIDATPMEGFNAKEYSKLLNLDEAGLQPVLVFPVGFRHDEDNLKDLKKVRKDHSEVIRFLN